jgi:hypothetical protein
MDIHAKRGLVRALLVALLALAGVGWHDRAAASGPQAGARDAAWAASMLAPRELDAMRGGFELPSGLLLSFGIERVAWVNGQMVSYLRIDIPDVAHMTPAQAQELAKLSQAQVVQVGPGNTFQGAGNAGLVIQNTLDGQQIRAQTTLDVGVNTLGLFQAINLGDALRNATTATPGTP